MEKLTPFQHQQLLNTQIYNSYSSLEKSDVYINNLQNRKLGRVGQSYGGSKVENGFDLLNNIESDWRVFTYSTPITVSLRSIKPQVDLKDYYRCSKGTFEDLFIDKDKWPTNKEVEDKWDELKKDKNLEFTQSPSSNSQYLVNKKTGDIYRKSDHWGCVASCFWSLDSKFKTKTTIAKINVSDLSKYETNHPSSFVNNPNFLKQGENKVEAIINQLSNKDRLDLIIHNMSKEGYSQQQIDRFSQKLADLKDQFIFIKQRFWNS